MACPLCPWPDGHDRPDLFGLVTMGQWLLLHTVTDHLWRFRTALLPRMPSLPSISTRGLSQPRLGHMVPLGSRAAVQVSKHVFRRSQACWGLARPWSSDHRTCVDGLVCWCAQARKPYVITKQRERWTDAEHARFLEALRLHGRAWRRIEGVG